MAGPHVTRFTSLCPFGTVTKQNLFALCLTPAQFMESEKLCEIPSDATHCPFHVPSDGKRAADAEVNNKPKNGVRYSLLNANVFLDVRLRGT